MTFSIEAFRLDGKVAVVAGAGGRGNSIGRAYASGLSAVGARVVVSDLNFAGAEAVAEEIVQAGGRAAACQVDITNQASVNRLAMFVEQTFGDADILVNNAGMMSEMLLAKAIDYPVDAWEEMMAVNVTGALRCSQAFVPQMRRRGGGRIVNQVSAGAFPAKSVYGISKLALVGLTQTLAAELGKENINVNAIAPGSTATDARNAMTASSQAMRAMMEQIVAGRFEGQPDELVGALILLCSPAGAWIHGQVFHVDGGWVL